MRHLTLDRTEWRGNADDQLFIIHEWCLLRKTEIYIQQLHIWRPQQHQTVLKTARGAKFHRTAHSRRPGSSLPFPSSDTVEGSAHGNNPENTARKAIRKNSDMFTESGL